MGGRLSLTLHAAVPVGASLGGEAARWRSAAGGRRRSGGGPLQDPGLLARGPVGGRRAWLARSPQSRSGGGAASPARGVRERGRSGKDRRAGAKLPPSWLLEAPSSVSPAPKGSLVGHFHSVPRRRAARHLFSISREAGANPGLRVAQPSQHSQTTHGS